jgi:hypothetical protein
MILNQLFDCFIDNSSLNLNHLSDLMEILKNIQLDEEEMKIVQQNISSVFKLMKDNAPVNFFHSIVGEYISILNSTFLHKNENVSWITLLLIEELFVITDKSTLDHFHLPLMDLIQKSTKRYKLTNPKFIKILKQIITQCNEKELKNFKNISENLSSQDEKENKIQTITMKKEIKKEGLSKKNTNELKESQGFSF